MDLEIVIGLMLIMVNVIHASTSCKAGFYSNGTTCVHCSHEPVTSSVAYLAYQVLCSGLCFEGSYGLQCSEKCSDFCKISLCQRWTGRCVHGCHDGWYGDTCNETCSPGCIKGMCHKEGTCVEGCKTGFYGSACTKCPQNCADCRSRYGCQKCKPGYYGKSCDSTCPNCNEFMCDFITGKCKLGCMASWYGGRCSQKCPSNGKTHNCNSTDGVCDGCKPGCRGLHCNLTCPKFCENCHQDEETCDVCKQGRYGHLCASSCNGCHNDLCDVKVICTLGYRANFYGPKCDRVRKCNPGCAQNTCDLTTGACTEGCSNSSYDTNHTYGHNCSQTCSDGCVGQDCDMTGICRQGCVFGWMGERCQVFTLWYLLSGCAATVFLTGCVSHWLCSRWRTKCCLQSRLYLNPVESSTSGDPESQDHIARRNSSVYTAPTYHFYYSIRNVDVIELEEIEPDENGGYETL